MNFLINTFNIVLYQPLFNVLVFLYEILPGNDFGIAVIILTVAIKFLLYPLASQGIKSQKALQDLQPKIKEIQDKYKENKEKQSIALLELYKTEKINPLSGCLPLLVQFPILIGLFQLFWRGFGPQQFIYLYNFIPNPGHINTSFLGLINLGQPSIFIALITGIAQFFQTKMMVSSQKVSNNKNNQDFSQIMQKQMLYFLPAFTVFILWKMPSAIGLYWLTTTVFTIGQQYIMLKKYDSK